MTDWPKVRGFTLTRQKVCFPWPEGSSDGHLFQHNPHLLLFLMRSTSLSYLYILYVQVGEGITICYLTQLLNPSILGHCCLWKVYSVLTIEDTEHH